MNNQQERVVIGKIVGLYGVRGWVKIFSDTQPKENIFNYTPWQIKTGGAWQPMTILAGRTQGKGLVAQLKGCDDREQARLFIGAEISIFRQQMPEAGEGEYYWSDLIGLEVINLKDEPLGRVDHLLETGANDVLVVKGEREHLIPFVLKHTVREVDLVAGTLRVDWDADF